ncbi:MULTISPECIES: XdhC family protein [Rhizobium]|uniref:XdhC family protein n=1 Tax=Rhizobium TaxID=379 RepID=UPI001C82E54F|nr:MULTISPECIES: XdhC family protein [Rhizobium]MBX4899408.1 XdhC family protein [Rhizobium bangladeshense]MBX5297410.1 XdhC family protein [Rhizobium sp. NLR15a]MBY3617621.1 XdhC family protein [Rhizobium bangladeshense]
MDEMVAMTPLPAPVQARMSDDPAEILRFAVECFDRGEVAIATLVDIRGGAARSLGSLVAVAVDGSYCGYVSGGCVEAAVAFDALLAIAEGRDRTLMFGQGSPFFDIALPCGGGITVGIHVLRDISAIRLVLERLERRQPVGLRYAPSNQSLVAVDPPVQSGWFEDEFLSVYLPRTRILISGRSLEARATARCATILGYDVIRIEKGTHYVAKMIDAFTAVVLLHHDLEAEAPLLGLALSSPAFYIGALGSMKTHSKRAELLTRSGFARTDIDRIKAPIGLFGPARDSTSLALSVLADIAAMRQGIRGS